MAKSFWIAWLVVLLSTTCIADAQEPRLRMNHIQAIGTHNSYRLAPPRELLTLIAIGSPKESEALDYSHLPIVDQLNALNIRQLELDLYADPDGGLFANPIGYATLSLDQKQTHPHPNADGAMDSPGMKVLHSPGFDYRSTEPTFVAALRSIRQWSRSHQLHIPILVLVELKQSAVGPVLVTPVSFDREHLDAVDREIRSVFGEDEFISPDQIRDMHEHLRDAVAANGWPLLDDVRGQVWFALDNEGDIRNLYLRDHPSLRGRAMFVSVSPEHSAAAFRKLNDPVGQFREIQRAVRGGLIVRTRADSETRQARSGDTARRDKAFQSGAQYISTDYPVPDPRWTDYQVNLPDHAEYRVIPRSLLRDRAPKE
ncbi:Ca2+-dependent phosphoinositide-specific phospholipase C [Rubripirellula reticaptiva]|uniref:Calcium-dependent phosphoinositide phospholipase C n=1 Tax=Rubripirellula reticaptiva TaxID=2528013 RepID=A0A5C6ENB5_9BACT|nr:Ca2+-dependent phosphoinositide-specific phospholipase C [Rubripirellula reticaptiva]TWU49076.1 hypothetical protein Poly59_36890 [Rubripirellula reticaptiva]